MKCGKCGGKMFVDRVFSENRNYELFCIICGRRDFISKRTPKGQWLDERENALLNATCRAEW